MSDNSSSVGLGPRIFLENETLTGILPKDCGYDTIPNLIPPRVRLKLKIRSRGGGRINRKIPRQEFLSICLFFCLLKFGDICHSDYKIKSENFQCKFQVVDEFHCA